jgi:spore coat protein CotH
VINPGMDGSAGGGGTGNVTGGSGGSGGYGPVAGTGGSVDAADSAAADRGIDAAPPPPPPSPDAPPATTPRPPGPSPRSLALYDESKVVDFYLTFPPGEWERLLNLARIEDDSRWARCSFTFEGETFADARCRRKGEPLIWAIETKPQIIVRFNFDNKMARFRGLRRLNLEYFIETDAPVRDRLGMWAMREAGLDAPRVNHARVFKDGQVLGLYQNIEAIDKEFLEDHFGTADSEGNLWESGFELKTNETMPDESRLQNLKAWVEREPLAGDHAAFYNAFDAMVDVDQIILEMAVETAILTDDNFSNGAANYYYYDHPRRGFMVLPWDLDTIFAAESTADLFAFWDGAPPNRMRELINQNATWRARFVDKLVEIRDRVLPRLPAEAQKICAQIRNYVNEDPNKAATMPEFDVECAWFQEKVPERIAEIRRMLGR